MQESKIGKVFGSLTVVQETESTRRKSGKKIKVFLCQCNTKEHKTWEAMRARCNNPNNDYYYLYGGKGVKVCDRWNSFENFIEDMGLKPSKSHSIERNDSNGNYEPSNCKWASKLEQAFNRCTTVVITHNGISHSLSSWHRLLKPEVSYTTFARHLKLGYKTINDFM